MMYDDVEFVQNLKKSIKVGSVCSFGWNYFYTTIHHLPILLYYIIYYTLYTVESSLPKRCMVHRARRTDVWGKSQRPDDGSQLRGWRNAVGNLI